MTTTETTTPREAPLAVRTRTGKKVHLAWGGSSVTFCGHWMKVIGRTMAPYARGQAVNCESCLKTDANDYLDADGFVVAAWDDEKKAVVTEGEEPEAEEEAPEAPAAPAIATTGSAIVAALESAWAAIQERVVDLPDVVFITGTGLMGRGAKWGHYRGHGWAMRTPCPEGCPEHADGEGGLVRLHGQGRKPEVFIAGERLAAGADLTLQTMLHEGAHALAAARGEKDTSKEGRYHNGTFLALAQEMGLAFEGAPDSTIGYSAVVLTGETREVYAQVVADLDAAIALYLDTFAGIKVPAGGEGDPGRDGETGGPALAPAPKKKARNNPKCVCPCGRILRASKAVLEAGPITCGLCGGDFEPEV